MIPLSIQTLKMREPPQNAQFNDLLPLIFVLAHYFHSVIKILKESDLLNPRKESTFDLFFVSDSEYLLYSLQLLESVCRSIQPIFQKADFSIELTLFP